MVCGAGKTKGKRQEHGGQGSWGDLCTALSRKERKNEWCVGQAKQKGKDKNTEVKAVGGTFALLCQEKKGRMNGVWGRQNKRRKDKVGAAGRPCPAPTIPRKEGKAEMEHCRAKGRNFAGIAPVERRSHPGGPAGLWTQPQSSWPWPWKSIIIIGKRN